MSGTHAVLVSGPRGASLPFVSLPPDRNRAFVCCLGSAPWRWHEPPRVSEPTPAALPAA